MCPFSRRHPNVMKRKKISSYRFQTPLHFAPWRLLFAIVSSVLINDYRMTNDSQSTVIQFSFV